MNKNNTAPLYFFIGTEAELIKIFPVLNCLYRKNIPYKVISSGQNNIIDTNIKKYILKPDFVDILISKNPIKQTPFGLLLWFIQTSTKGFFLLRKELLKGQGVFIVHGDTVSTVMGSLLGKLLGYKIAHIEAGLRSFNFLHPFPEEIDRVITSHFSDLNFCPNEWAAKNISSKKGEIVITKGNTLIDSLYTVINTKHIPDVLKKLKKEKYFLFVIHRQENIYNEQLVKNIVQIIENQAKKMKCIFLLHKPTEIAFEQYTLLPRIRRNKNIFITPRLAYDEFMKVLNQAEFIITDGGSNQEESYYLGKPCLILRMVTERTEGINENVVISKNDLTVIRQFIATYQTYKRQPLLNTIKPSQIIANRLISN